MAVCLNITHFRLLKMCGLLRSPHKHSSRTGAALDDSRRRPACMVADLCRHSMKKSQANSRQPMSFQVVGPQICNAPDRGCEVCRVAGYSLLNCHKRLNSQNSSHYESLFDCFVDSN